MRRVAIIATASGCGKTTFGRALATRLGVPFFELDAIHWQAGWTELDATELRRLVEPIVTGGAWVIDGSYRMKLGDLAQAVECQRRRERSSATHAAARRPSQIGVRTT